MLIMYVILFIVFGLVFIYFWGRSQYHQRQNREAVEEHWRLEAALREASERDRVAKLSKEERQYEHDMIALALTCRRCRQLASPLSGTGNRYRCGGCETQFAAAFHGVHHPSMHRPD